MFLDEERLLVKWSIPERVVEQGRTIVHLGGVENFHVNLNTKQWEAIVNDDNHIYHVRLDGTTKEQDECECEYWHERGFCKHTVAVELELRERGYSRIIERNESIESLIAEENLALELSQSFKSLQTKLQPSDEKELNQLDLEIHMEMLEPQYYFEKNRWLVIWLKIGLKDQNRKLLVKSMAQFMRTYEKQGLLEMTSATSFSLAKENFSEEDQVFLEKAYSIFFSNCMVNDQGLLAFQEHPSQYKRYLFIPIPQAKPMLELLNHSGKLNLAVKEDTYHSLEFDDNCTLVACQIRKKDKDITVEIKTQVDHILPSYHLVLSQNHLISISERQMQIYQTLLSTSDKSEDSIFNYKLSEMADFFAYVYPLLKQIGIISIADDVKDVMIYSPLKTNIYLEKRQKILTMRVDFCYGDIIISNEKEVASPISEQEKVIRQYKKEGRVRQVITGYGYHISEDVLYTKKMPQQVELYQFFSEEVPALRKVAKVHLSEELSALFLDGANYQPKIEVTEMNSLLDIKFDIEHIAEDEIDAIIQSLVNRDQFYQMASGALLTFDSEEYHKTSDALIKIRDGLNIKNGMIETPLYRGIQVQEVLKETGVADFSHTFKEMVHELTHYNDVDITLPTGLNASLRDYQVDGFKWLSILGKYHFGGILADDMGLGKTIQTITYILSQCEANDFNYKTLIIAPASLIYNWDVEVRKFSPSLRSVVVTGSKHERVSAIDEFSEDGCHIVITSYQSARQDIESYKKLSLDALILDEAQMVKNSATKTFQSIKELDITTRFALSGTPIENRLEELWSLFQLLMPGFFPSKQKFNKLPTTEIARMVQPFILRREKKDVLKDLPEKMETNLYSSLTSSQKKIYLAYLKQMQQSIKEMNSNEFRSNRISILSGLTRLRQICCDPHIFMDDYEGDSGKLEQLLELMESAKANNRRVLIFSQFTSMLQRIEVALNREEISTFYLHGGTKPVDRINMVNAFNSGEKDAFLISLKAGGTGLNLTGADTVVLFDLWWNPAVEEQATGRAHRIGQKKTVEVWRLIAEGTIEEKIYELQEQKRELFNQIMNADETNQVQALTEKDIREILSIGVE